MRAQFFGKAHTRWLCLQHGIREIKNFRRAAIIGFNFMNRGLGVAFVKTHDIIKIGTPPGVDALGVVTHRHHLMMDCERINNFGLQSVGILKFIDQNLLESILIISGHFAVLAQKLEQIDQ